MGKTGACQKNPDVAQEALLGQTTRAEVARRPAEEAARENCMGQRGPRISMHSVSNVYPHGELENSCIGAAMGRPMGGPWVIKPSQVSWVGSTRHLEIIFEATMGQTSGRPGSPHLHPEARQLAAAAHPLAEVAPAGAARHPAATTRLTSYNANLCQHWLKMVVSAMDANMSALARHLDDAVKILYTLHDELQALRMEHACYKDFCK
uniref:Uncharacterized protein n=1 Tax=Leersia perrieri TaxID=77586 RepID=A0A0D9XFF9_9ORYZ